MFISGIYALSNEVINNTESIISTSAVEIDIKQYDADSQEYENDIGIVFPGDELSIITKINNLGIDCYIRTKISYMIGGIKYDEATYITGDFTNWTKNGNYYYYDSALSKDESITVFNKIKIPSSLNKTFQNKDIIVSLTAEAVQKENFDGNWNDVTIQKSVNKEYDINIHGESTVIYENDSVEHIILDDNFFDDLGNLLPGSKKESNIQIINKSNKENKYYISIDHSNLTNQELELFKKIAFTIKKQNGNIVYEGDLGNKDNILLGQYLPNQKDTFTLELYIPKTLNNDFSKLVSKIIWKFSLDKVEKMENPKTGFKIKMAMSIFLASTTGFIVVLFLEKRERDYKIK